MSEIPAAIPMNYLPQHQLLFAHIPKTGGVSVYRQLVGWWSPDRFHVPLANTRKKAHELGWAEEYERACKFTIVRNPWDRLASMWGYYMTMSGDGDSGETEVHNYYDYRNVEISQHIKKQNDFNSFIRQWDTFPLVADFRRTQVDYLRDDENPSWGFLADRILQFEQLAADWRRFAADQGLPENWRTLGHCNKSNRPPYRSLYDDWSRDFVAERFAEDIERLGYSF